MRQVGWRAAVGLVFVVAACGGCSNDAEVAAAAGITATMQAIATHTTLAGFSSLMCQAERGDDPALLARVAEEESRTGVPALRPFPPDDRDWQEIVGFYAKVVVPGDAVSLSSDGDAATVDFDRVKSQTFLEGMRVRFERVDGQWLFCDRVVFPKEGTAEVVRDYLTGAAGFRP